MNAKDLISEGISPLMTSDTGIEALSMMEEYKVKHLPIVNQELLLGVIAEEDVFVMSEPESAIGSFSLSLQKPYVFENQHIYDVIKEVVAQKLTLMPVVDSQMRYLGTINLSDLLAQMAIILAIDQPGGIIVLQMNEHDYSLGEMAQIVESNDAKVLSVQVLSLPNTTMIDVTIKINRLDISGVAQTLERYGYQIKSTIVEEKEEEFDDRYDSLMKYLNI